MGKLVADLPNSRVGQHFAAPESLTCDGGEWQWVGRGRAGQGSGPV